MKVLGGVDAAFLHLETPETPMHVASLSLFDLPRGFRGDFHAKVRRELGRRLHLAPVLHRKLAPMPLHFTPAAKSSWITFHDDIERELRRGGELVDIRDVASKSADNAARLAALFQVFEHGPSDIGADA